MTDSTNKPEPSKRMRPASGAPAFKPTARKSVKQPASKPVQTPKAEAIPKASKPAKAAKAAQSSTKTLRIPKATRASKIPRTTTTSKASKAGTLSSAPSRLSSSSSPWASQGSSSTTQGFGTIGGDQQSKARSAQSARNAFGRFSRTQAASPNARVREKGMPAARTPSTSNEFIAYTKSHLQIMIPVFIIVALLLIYTCVDIFSSFGRIHPGVSVQGIEVGGMSVQDAATKINEELSPKLSNAHVTIYESADIASAMARRFRQVASSKLSR